MKKTHTLALISTAVVGSALTLSAFAHEHKHEHEEHEHHGKHEHGVADMDIALDGKQLLVQLTSPSANFLGFEHEPSTKAQKEAYEKLAKTLNNPSTIIELKGGQCTIADKDIDLPYGDDDHHEHEHEEHHHAKKDHDHDEHEKHEDHDHESTHSDIEFQYVYTCKKPKSLEHIDVQLFKHFNGFEKINVQWLSNNKQGHATLTPKHTEVELHEHNH